MRKVKILIVLLLTICSGTKILAQSDYLAPSRGINDSSGFHSEYYSKIRKVFFQGLTTKPIIRFFVLPSFTPENVLDIEFDGTNKKHFLIYSICEKMIWGNDNWEQTKLIIIKKEISKESVALTKALFETAIQGTKNSKGSVAGLDGVNYDFTVNSMGELKTGTVWSPSSESKMGRLVNVGLELIRLAKTDIKVIEFDEKLKEQIIQLTTDLIK